VFSTGCAYSERLQLLKSVFPAQSNVTLYEADNPGYQKGAMLAVDFALERNWFAGYDWVIRLNADVIIRNDTWFLETMRDDTADGIFVDCMDKRCPARRRCQSAHIHTDFFAVRPRAFKVDPSLAGVTNAEVKSTAMFRPIVLAGRDRWVPNTAQRASCRVRGEKSPVIHDHEYLKSCANETL